MLLPAMARGLGRPDRGEFEALERIGMPVHAHMSPGHVQVMIALSSGPHSVGRLAEVIGVSRPAATQLVDRLEEHGIVERHPAPEDRRVVLVDYVPGMQEMARRMMETRRNKLKRVMDRLTDEEAGAMLKGLELLVESLEDVRNEEEVNR